MKQFNWLGHQNVTTGHLGLWDDLKSTKSPLTIYAIQLRDTSKGSPFSAQPVRVPQCSSWAPFGSLIYSPVVFFLHKFIRFNIIRNSDLFELFIHFILLIFNLFDI